MEASRSQPGYTQPRYSPVPPSFEDPAEPFAGATELLGRCLDGRQEEDWSRLVELFGPSLRGLLVRVARRHYWIPTEDELDDLVQDLYLSLLRRRGRPFRSTGRCGFWAYLEVLARNLLIDRLRHEYAAKRGVREEPFGLLNNVDFDWQRRPHLVRALVRRLADRGPSPEEQVIRCSGRRLFFRFCLSSHRRTVNRCSVDHPYAGPGAEAEIRSLYLVFIEGCSSSEVSRALDGVLRPKQVDGLVLRFRRFMARDGIVLPGRRSRAVGVPPRLRIRKSKGGRKKKGNPARKGRPGKRGNRGRRGGRTKRG